MKKQRLYLALVGSTLILTATACGSRKQYGNDGPPANPERDDATLVSTIPLDSPNDNTADTTAITEVGTASDFSPAEVQSIINAWHKAPVVWNRSAGDIELGKTNYTEWTNRFSEMQKAYNFQAGVFPSDTNTKNVRGLAIPTTVKEIVVTQVYEGSFSLPTEKGEMQTIRPGQSFVLKGFFQAAADKADVEDESTATRGQTFFKNLYNSFVKGDEGGADFDCFAEKICRYQLERDYFILRYESPRKETGEIWISIKNNIFVQAKFARPEYKFASNLYAEDVTFDLVNGKFITTGATPREVIGIGASYERFKSVEPEVAPWLSFARLNVQDFVGATLGFQKNNLERIDDLDYVEAEPSDTLSEISLDKNYLNQAKRQRLLKIGNETFNFYRKNRVNLKKQDLLTELEGIKFKLDSAIKQAGGEILQSYIENRYNNRKFTVSDNERVNMTYSLFVSFKLNGLTRDILISNRLEEPAAFVTYKAQTKTDESLNFLNQLPAEERGSQKSNVAIGQFAIDRPIVLTEMDKARREATLNMENGEKVKINYAPYETLYRKYVNATGVVTTEDIVVSSFSLNNLIVYFRQAASCGAYQIESPDQYCVVGLESYAFSDQASVKKFAALESSRAELRGQLQVCGKTLKFGMTRAEFQSTFVDAPGCPVASLESQANRTDKFVYYLPKANVAVRFLGDDSNTLSSFLFY